MAEIDKVETTDNEIMSTGNQKTPTTTSTTIQQPVSAAPAESSSMDDANQLSQKAATASTANSNVDVTQLPSSSTETTMDNEKPMNGDAALPSNDDSSMNVNELPNRRDEMELNSAPASSPSDLNNSEVAAPDANRTNSTPDEGVEKRDEQVTDRKEDEPEVEKAEAQCDSVDSLKMCNENSGRRPDAEDDGDARQVNGGGEQDKCNEIDKNDSNCDSSDILNADESEASETTVAVTVNNANESELKTNESNNNDIIDEPKSACSEAIAPAPTNGKSNENSIECVAAETTTARACATPNAVKPPETMDVKSDSAPLEAQAIDKGGEGEATERPRNAISVIAESKIKKTCDLLDEHTRPEQNAISSSSAADTMVTAADKRTHSHDLLELTAKSYERKVIVSPPKSSAYHTQPAVVEQKSRPSMYVNAPDFSRPSLRDLSSLQMKPPDFSKLSRSSELHVSNPDFSRAYDARPKVRALHEVNASNFAEISKKYNYVSDLQLKNKSPVPATTTSAASSSTSSSPAPSVPSMYVRPPDFSSSKVRSRMENESSAEEPAAHVIQPKFRIQADSSSKSSSASSATPIHNEFPQISNDVTMSLVSSQPRPAPTPPSSTSTTMQNGTADASFYAARHERHRYSAGPPPEHPNAHGYYQAGPPRSTYAEDVHRQNAAPNFHPSMHQHQHQPVISRPIPMHQNYHRPYDVHAASHERIEYTRQPTPFEMQPHPKATDSKGMPMQSSPFHPSHAQMNPPPMSAQKWPPSQQQRITQSPISLASSPHSVSSQNTNQLYPSPHATPSPSSFGYPAAPSPVSTLKHSSSPLLSSAEPPTPYRNPTPTVDNAKYTAPTMPKRSAETSKKTSTKTSKDATSRATESANSKPAAKSAETNYAKYSHNYRHGNTIVDPFVYRQSSEADLNYQIIKKTLNKEIPVPSFNRRPDAPPPTAMPMPSRAPASTPHESAEMKMRKNADPKLVFLDHKTQSTTSSSYPSSSSSSSPASFQSKQSNHVSRAAAPAERSTYDSRVPPQTNGIGVHRPPSTTPVNSHHYPLTSHTRAPTEQPIPMKIVSPSPNLVSSTKPTPSSSVFQPQMKRESPLDLSVKTVKTKADSTGVYDYSVSSAIPQSLKVDFAPNFSAGPSHSARRAPEVPMPSHHHRPQSQQSSMAYARPEPQPQHQPPASSAPSSYTPSPPVPSKAPMHRPYETTAQAEQRNRQQRESTAPIMIFGQKPEELKNFPPPDNFGPPRPNSHHHRGAVSGEPVAVIAQHQSVAPKEGEQRAYAYPAPPHLPSNHIHYAPIHHPPYEPSNDEGVKSNRDKYFESRKVIAKGNDYRHTPTTSPASMHEPAYPPPPHHLQHQQQQQQQHSKPNHPGYGSHGANPSTRKRLPETNNFAAENCAPPKQPRYQQQTDRVTHSMLSTDSITDRVTLQQQHSTNPLPPHPQSRQPQQQTDGVTHSIPTTDRVTDRVSFSSDRTVSRVALPQQPILYPPPTSSYYGQMPPADAYHHMQHHHHQQQLQQHQQQQHHHQQQQQHYHQMRTAMHPPPPTTTAMNHVPQRPTIVTPTVLQMSNRKDPPAPPTKLSHGEKVTSYIPPSPHHNNNIYPPPSGPPPNHGIRHAIEHQNEWQQSQRKLMADYPMPPAPHRLPFPSANDLPKPSEFTRPIETLQATAAVTLVTASAIGGGSNGNIACKGVDQSVISKLRNNLEQKEIEKQKVLKNSASPVVEADDQNKSSEIASIIAARIRTKGELKGFTPLPPAPAQPASLPSQPPQPKTIEAEKSPKPTVDVVVDKLTEVVCKVESTASAFDLMDWGSTCNDFLKQLQNGGSNSAKKRAAGKAQRRLKGDDGHETSTSSKETVTAPKPPSSSASTSKTNDSSSDDEDNKPLHLLRQQSLSENSKSQKEISENDSEPKVKSATKGSPSSTASKIAKEKQRDKREREKRLLSRGSSSSSDSSDSEQDGAEDNKRQSKKIIRKPRTRDSGSSTTPAKNNDKATAAQKKRGRCQSSSDSDVVVQKPAKKNKSKQLAEDSSSSSSGSNTADAPNAKNAGPSNTRNSIMSSDEDEPLSHDAEETIPAHIVKKKKSSPVANHKVEETMTRSKRKRELETQIANSKVLRNDKMIKCVAQTPGDTKSTTSSTTPSKRQSKSTSESSAGKGQQQQMSASESSKTRSKKRTSAAADTDNDESKSPNPKRKNTRSSKVQTSSSESEESASSEAEPENVTERLRSRKAKVAATATTGDAVADEKANGTKKDGKASSRRSSKCTPTKKGAASTATTTTAELDVSEESRFQPGWEEEVYEYKRSLKIPPSLITVGRPSWHRKSTSLPDLDPQHSSDASETFAEFNKKMRAKGMDTMTPASTPLKKRACGSASKKATLAVIVDEKQATASEPDAKTKSIIDVLHQRVFRPVVRKKSRHHSSQNEPKILPQSNEAELLPTPGSKGNVFKSENVFETAVLKSRTRKEYRAMKNQEIIREVFGGEDRPASAPPAHFEIAAPADGLVTVKQEPQQEKQQLTYDQQYEQYVKQMNIDFGEKIRKLKGSASATVTSTSTTVTTPLLIPKVEKMDEDSLLNPDDDETQDTELNECCDAASKDALGERVDTPSVMSEVEGATPTSFKGVLKSGKKARSNRHSRRKGSSGFDYIRKKKKPLPMNADGTPMAVTKRRSAAVNYLEVKNESDITREIRSWVLNKGVGESVLHKAARLGYIDVIVYCLERLDMHPDQKDNAGYTPLHEACSRGRVDIARALLQYGANHSETAHSGIRPLHEAVDNGYMEIVRLLLSYGADPLLATYAGQTPIMLAEDDDEMVALLKNHLYDVQNTGPTKMPWKFKGAWEIYDPNESGFNIFDDVPTEIDCKAINEVPQTVPAKLETLETPPKVPEKSSKKSSPQSKAAASKVDANSPDDNDSDLFEIEESEAPLVPLYQLRDEGMHKWVLLSDLCYVLKVKSKDTLLKQLCPASSPPTASTQKDLLREMRMAEFLEKATCLQLLCAGEKLNIRSSKVVLIKYNDSVKNLLGVETVVMRL